MFTYIQHINALVFVTKIKRIHNCAVNLSLLYLEKLRTFSGYLLSLLEHIMLYSKGFGKFPYYLRVLKLGMA